MRDAPASAPWLEKKQQPDGEVCCLPRWVDGWVGGGLRELAAERKLLNVSQLGREMDWGKHKTRLDTHTSMGRADAGEEDTQGHTREAAKRVHVKYEASE